MIHFSNIGDLLTVVVLSYMEGYTLSDGPLETLDGESRSFHFIVTGRAPVQSRPRFYRGRNGFIPRAYDPSSAQKLAFTSCVQQAFVGFDVDSFRDNARTKRRGVVLDAVFWEVRPRSHFRPNGRLLEGVPEFPPKRDVDNQLKFVMDSLSGIFYSNDSCVRRGIAEKRYFPNLHLPIDAPAQERQSSSSVEIVLRSF